MTLTSTALKAAKISLLETLSSYMTTSPLFIFITQQGTTRHLFLFMSSYQNGINTRTIAQIKELHDFVQISYSFFHIIIT